MNQTLRAALSAAFRQDLSRDGDTWKLGRPSTFADMMLLHRKKVSRYEDADLQSIFNWGMRYNLCKGTPVKVTGLCLKTIQTELGSAVCQIMESYELALDDVFSRSFEQHLASFYDLTRELDYLAVLDQLDLEADFDLLINRICSLALSLLLQSFGQMSEV